MSLKLERTVTVGNLLTVASFIVLLIMAWVKTDARIANLEIATITQNKAIAAQSETSQKLNEAIQELRVVTVRLVTLAEIYIPKIENSQGKR